jgi:hypothetical protein
VKNKAENTVDKAIRNHHNFTSSPDGFGGGGWEGLVESRFVFKKY